MPNLLTAEELEIWSDLEALEDDLRVLMILEKASIEVADGASCPQWLDSTPLDEVPRRARTIALVVASRVHTNPDQEIASGIGPLSSRVADEVAAGIYLTEREAEELEAIGAKWLEENGGAPAEGLFTLSMVRRGRRKRTAYIPDSSGSDWMIPYGDLDSTDAFTTADDTLI